MSRASDYAIALFKQSHGPLRCLAASDPCGRRSRGLQSGSGKQSENPKPLPESKGS
jgi:hypothetical protein